MASKAEPVALSGTEGRVSCTPPPAPAPPPPVPPPPVPARPLPPAPPPGSAPDAPPPPATLLAPPLWTIVPPPPATPTVPAELPPTVLPDAPGLADCDGLSEPQAATDSKPKRPRMELRQRYEIGTPVCGARRRGRSGDL